MRFNLQSIAGFFGLDSGASAQFPLFAKIDRTGIARYVSADVTRWVTLSKSGFDIADSNDGRNKLAENIYSRLLEHNIAYDKEPFYPTQGIQVIRSPGEILEHPKRGTCLDLSLLYCGLLIGNGLLPILVITKGHAFVLVSLEEPLEKWNSLGRSVKHFFIDGPFTNDNPKNTASDGKRVLLELVDGNKYIAVECTGFATSAKLEGINSREHPETQYRKNGVMSFASAVKAGREQLACDTRPFQYAIDIATAHYAWNVAPYAIPQVPNEIRLKRARLWGRSIAALALTAVLGLYIYFRNVESTEAIANRVERQVLTDFAPEELRVSVKQNSHAVVNRVSSRMSERIKGRYLGMDSREHIRLAAERSRAHLWLSLVKNRLPLDAMQIPSDISSVLTRSYVIRDMQSVGIPFENIIHALDVSPSSVAGEGSILQGLLLAAAEYELGDQFPGRDRLLLRVSSDLFQRCDDPGVHAAAMWILSTRLGDSGKQALAEETSKIVKGIERLRGKDPKVRHWFIEPTAGITMIYIPKNVNFLMGSEEVQNDGELLGNSKLYPWKRNVFIPRAFAVSMTEVTEEQFALSLAKSESNGLGKNYAQTCNWLVAAEFCNWLSEAGHLDRYYSAISASGPGYSRFGNRRFIAKDGDLSDANGIRLPTECEWEYVCKAFVGKSARLKYCCGNDAQLLSSYASYQGDRHVVALRRPNLFGFFDVHGGVSEWCDDNPSPYEVSQNGWLDKSSVRKEAAGNEHILRGGSFKATRPGESLNAFSRDSEVEYILNPANIGFRIAQTIDALP